MESIYMLKSMPGDSVDLSFYVFPYFAVVGGPKIPRCWEKTAWKVSLSHPFLCAPDASKNQDLRAVSPPHMLAGKARGKWQIDPILPKNIDAHLRPQKKGKRGWNAIHFSFWKKTMQAEFFQQKMSTCVFEDVAGTSVSGRGRRFQLLRP